MSRVTRDKNSGADNAQRNFRVLYAAACMGRGFTRAYSFVCPPVLRALYLASLALLAINRFVFHEERKAVPHPVVGESCQSAPVCLAESWH